MTSIQSKFALYNITLNKPTAINATVFGNFATPKTQDMVVAKGTRLELQRADESGRMMTILSWECFGLIRSLAPFRLPGANKDYLIVGSDSGRIDILQYDANNNKFKKIHEETYGRTGCRRIVPGQYLASDPRGRAVMIGAIEKQKFVYILNRDAATNLTISSPLEAHKSNAICFGICGVDVGFENPVFAALEVDYEELDNPSEDSIEPAQPIKNITFYELDLGLNHVVRKWSDSVDFGANMLLTVPGDTDGPGGVLVCAEDFLIWKNQDHQDVRVPIPRRNGVLESTKVLITASCLFKQKDMFFYIVQSEFGDLYKVSLTWNDTQVTDIRIKYFDTCPPAIALNITRNGMLFAASETGAHHLFQIQSIGDDDETAIETSAAEFQALMEQGHPFSHAYFSPREPRNLALTDEIDSLSPLLDVKVADLTKEDTPQIYAACGRGARSSLKILRQGLSVTTRAETDLFGNPNAVWSVKRTKRDLVDSYIVVSFINSTIVLSIGDTVQEVSDSGFLDSTTTLHVAQIGEDALLQVHPEGLRFIRADKRINEWKPPGKKKIVRAASNDRQVLIALTGGEVIFFELDPNSQMLTDVDKREMNGQDVTCLSLPPLAKGTIRARFAAVGLADNTVRVLSLDINDHLQQVTMQAVGVQPSSLAFLNMNTSSSSSSGQEIIDEDLFLFIGLANGVLIRSHVDSKAGTLTDMRKRFLGTRPIKLIPVVTVTQTPAILALSSRVYLAYTLGGRHFTSSLCYDMLESASAFISEQVPAGIVSCSGEKLRIFTLDKLGDAFNQTSIPLRYTPRKLLLNQEHSNVILIESDHSSYSYDEIKQLQKELQELNSDTKVKQEDDMDIASSAAAAFEPQEAFIGPLKAPAGKWASCIRIIDPSSSQTIFIQELADNEAAFSVALVRFPGSEERYLAVGTVKDLVISPRSFSANYIHIYRLSPDGRSFELVHKTQINDVPLAMTEYPGMGLLASAGKTVRIYDLGQKKLLRKSEFTGFPTCVQGLQVIRDRIYGGDMAEAFQFLKYRKADKSMFVFAENTTPRYLTASCAVDYHTMAGGDKFGNILVSRIPDDYADDAEDTSAATVSSAVFNNNTNKLCDIASFYVGDTVTSISHTRLITGGTEVLLYSTIAGTIGALVPLTSRDDLEFFTTLEMHMRQNSPSLVGRDHLSFRSYYFPVKATVDGDLCEQYSSLDFSKQTSIASDLVRTPNEVNKRLEEIRSKVL